MVPENIKSGYDFQHGQSESATRRLSQHSTAPAFRHYHTRRGHMALNRNRDKDGTEERKRNDTLVRTLRDEYGITFAPDVRSDMELGTLKDRLGLESDASLNDILRHYGIKK